MKLIVTLPLLILSFFAASAANPDSLRHELKSLSDGESKLQILIELSRSTYQSSPTEALEYALMQKDLAIKLGDKKALGKAHAWIGFLRKKAGYLGDAVLNYKYAIDVFLELGEELYLADNLANLGVIHLTAQEYEHALTYFQKALQIFKKHNDEKQTSITLRNIGWCYAELRNDGLAFESYNESLEIELERKDDNALCMLYIKWGDLYRKRGEYDKAKKHFLQAIELEGLRDKEMQKAIAYNNVGETYFDEGRYNEAETWYQKAIEIKTVLDDDNSLMHTLNNMGVLKFKQGKFERSIKYFDDALNLTKPDVVYPSSGEHSLYLDSALQHTKDNASIVKMAHHNEIYSKSSRFQAHQLILFEDLKDKLETVMLQNQIRINLKIPELTNQVKEAERENIIILILAGLLAICIAALTYFYLQNRKDLRKKRDILNGVGVKIELIRPLLEK